MITKITVGNKYVYDGKSCVVVGRKKNHKNDLVIISFLLERYKPYSEVKAREFRVKSISV